VLTLTGTGRAEIEIKRSRFVAHAARIDHAEEAPEFHAAVSDPGATHNCWAWKLDQAYRFSDDGEPASTAGRPILAAIEGKQLDHAMIVVTRYFGGIKLGAGGLVRAYSAAASRAIDAAGIREERPAVDCSIQAGFQWTGQVYAALDAIGAERLEESYPEGSLRIRARVDASKFGALSRALRDMTRGEARVRKLD
jgi:uncharacterized YigZ family protein